MGTDVLKLVQNLFYSANVHCDTIFKIESLPHQNPATSSQQGTLRQEWRNQCFMPKDPTALRQKRLILLNFAIPWSFCTSLLIINSVSSVFSSHWLIVMWINLSSCHKLSITAWTFSKFWLLEVLISSMNTSARRALLVLEISIELNIFLQ